MKVLHCVGARPNFIKLAPVMSAFDNYPVEQILIHTGQHYDDGMSKVFFRELNIPSPDVNFGIAASNDTAQVAGIMIAMHPVLEHYNPDWVMVYGDVNSTLACALTAAQLNIPIAHIESGLRSFDRTMPEEKNRVIVDHISQLLFCTERGAVINLEREGVLYSHFVGNVMIDTLVKYLPRVLAFAITEGEYVLVTLHRPRNVDDPERLSIIVEQLNTLSEQYQIIFPAHPRTKRALTDVKLKFKLREPLGYMKFLMALQGARVVITDSGGVQEEAAYLGIPCITVRPVTERPITLSYGNVLTKPSDIVGKTNDAIQSHWGLNCKHPEFWDGNAAERIVRVVVDE